MFKKFCQTKYMVSNIIFFMDINFLKQFPPPCYGKLHSESLFCGVQDFKKIYNSIYKNICKIQYNLKTMTLNSWEHFRHLTFNERQTFHQSLCALTHSTLHLCWEFHLSKLKTSQTITKCNVQSLTSCCMLPEDYLCFMSILLCKQISKYTTTQKVYYIHNNNTTDCTEWKVKVSWKG